MLAEGDAAGAADLLTQILERVPAWVPARMALAAAEERLGHLKAAAEAFAEADALDPAGLFGAGLHLARLRPDAVPAAMPDAYVAALFDGYAPRFERHLVENLGYRAPALMAEDLRVHCGERRFGQALDLGCGTGLMGRAIRGRVDALDGVDLSSSMVAQAAATGLYLDLQVGGIGQHLAGTAGGIYDLVLAADVFAYVGALDRVMAEVARVLVLDGVTAFTLQRSERESIRLGSDLRFSHSAEYIRAIGAEAGLELLGMRNASIRRERGIDVPGLVVVARKP